MYQWWQIGILYKPITRIRFINTVQYKSGTLIWIRKSVKSKDWEERKKKSNLKLAVGSRLRTWYTNSLLSVIAKNQKQKHLTQDKAY